MPWKCPATWNSCSRTRKSEEQWLAKASSGFETIVGSPTTCRRLLLSTGEYWRTELGTFYSWPQSLALHPYLRRTPVTHAQSFDPRTKLQLRALSRATSGNHRRADVQGFRGYPARRRFGG